MINRILIRMKVVQMLYSYLLVEKDFSIESQPTPPTKEKRFAYASYLDLIVLMIDISHRIKRRSGEEPLASTRFITNVENDDKIRSLMNRYRAEGFALEPLAEKMAETIKESAIYKNFIKEPMRSENSDMDVWRDLFNHIIFPSSELREAIGAREGYTLRGYERAGDMMQQTFVNFYSSRGHVSEAVKTLDKSLEAARRLYFALLQLPIDITEFHLRRLEENRNKYLPSEEDRNPNLRFAENGLVETMRSNYEISKYTKDNKISWLSHDYQLLNSLMKAISESEIYREYMAAPTTDYQTDCELWRNLFKQVIFRNDTFLEELEDKSVFWNDDLEIIGTFMLKTLKRFEDAGTLGIQPNDRRLEPVMPMFKDEEDARFGADLLTAAIRNRDKYKAMIDRFVNSAQWDSERLAFMDVVVLLAAIAELLTFPKIPTLVTINEYIELAKSYSTPKSGAFVHGILASIIASLREEGILTKE